MNNIYLIGLPKTGIKSIQFALEFLGETSIITTDYERIAIDNPNSKFILTLRHCNEWFKSLIKHQESSEKIDSSKYFMNLFSLDSPDMSVKTLKRNRIKIIDAYNKRNLDAIKFFMYTDRLKLMSNCKNFNWETLTKFTNHENNINISFPKIK